VQLSKLIPKDKIAIAESGIGSVQDMEYLKKYGYKGFLIGESFMKTEFPHKTLEAFLAS
jgi:indole-3-glycerol phosphate synthase